MSNRINLGLYDESNENNIKSNETSNDSLTNRLYRPQETINFNNLVNSNKDSINNFNKPKKDESEFFDNLDDFNFNSEVNVKIFGLGGAGNNMVQYIAEHTNINRKCLYAINTDWQFLKTLPTNLNRALIGRVTTKGMGSGSDPVIGEKAAIEDEQLLRDKLEGTDLLFIVSGMGKGTGTGASPVVARIAKELNILTIAVVNLPSETNEGKIIYEKGAKGLNELRKYVDGLSVISNEKIINNFSNKEITLKDSFTLANRFIANIVNEITNLVNVPAQINIDFNDVKTFFNEQTVFHLNTFNLRTPDNIKEQIINEIENVIYQDDIHNSSKAILNLKLNPSVPNTIISIIREALEEKLKTSDFTLSYAVDYSDEIEFANISILISSEKTNYELMGNKSCNISTSNSIDNDKSINSDFSKSFNLEDLNLSNNNVNITGKLSFHSNTINDKITKELKSDTNNIREENNKMKKFIDINNINTESIGYLENANTKIDEITKKDKKPEFSILDEITSNYKKNANEEFDDLQKRIKTDSRFYAETRQEITITKQIKENNNKNMNSTSLNKFFTKTLRYSRFNDEQKNSKN